MKLDEMDRKIIVEMAEKDLNVTAVARKMYLHRNTVVYHLDKIKRKTGLDPRKFYDLVKLLDLPIHPGISF